MSSALIVVGLLVAGFGIWTVIVSRDPLGYSPTFTYNLASVGFLMFFTGLAWRYFS